jgi:hypothetical protein
MRQYNYFEKGFTFKRITKRAAKKAYMNGLTIILCPVNLRPGAPWHNETTLHRKQREQFVIDEIGLENDFYNMIGSFEYYNCTNSETGYYTAFYIPVETVDRFTGGAPTAETIGTIEQYNYKFMEP